MNQLALPLQLEDHAVFESFLPDNNEQIVAFLHSVLDAAEGPGMWLCGRPSTGKTHLLQAFCERAGDGAQYLPLRELQSLGPAVVDGMAERRFVCIDDVDVIAGAKDWELALFALWNALHDVQGILLCTANSVPNESHFELPDLLSRFSRLPVFQLRALDEEQQVRALQLRARHRGLELPNDTTRYLLSRRSRDMASLYTILDRLDSEALAAKRRLTIPFVKQVIDSDSFT